MNARTGVIFLEGFVLPILAVVFVGMVSTITMDFPWYRITGRLTMAVGLIYAACLISDLAHELRQQK